MVSAHYTRHMKGHVSLQDLYGLCVNARTDSGKSLAVWMQQIWRSGNRCRNTLPVYFPESLCERGLREPVSRDWPLVYLEQLFQCPEVEDWQGTTELSALETSLEVASLPEPLCFWADAERWAPWSTGGGRVESQDHKHRHTPRSVPSGSSQTNNT